MHKAYASMHKAYVKASLCILRRYFWCKTRRKPS